MTEANRRKDAASVWEELAALRAESAAADDPDPEGTAYFGPAHDREKRRRQLQFLQAFFNDPSVVQLREEPATTSSSPEEIEARKSLLQYRIKLLEALLEVFREELDALARAEAANGATGDGSQGT